MSADTYLDLAKQLKSGAMDEREFVRRVKLLPFMDLGDVKIDTHRAIRTNFAEVVFCPGKSLDHLKSIASSVDSPEERVLFSRITPEQAVTVGEILQGHVHFPKARLLGSIPPPEGTIPGVTVVSAGTSDIPVAEEAAVTAEYLGCSVNRLFDVGVAGIHRLFEHLPMLQDSKVIVVVAGMEGALPTVVGGLVSCPVIAVPTSVGYGANLQGLAPLLTMLNSCALGVSVVNIDNGTGAGFCAGQIARQSHHPEEPDPAP
ncbi:MAG: nickel pincer cofactor biosynthesis protein LarB [Thermovirgaceae bacterium]